MSRHLRRPYSYSTHITQTQRLLNFCDHLTDAAAGKADGACCALGKVKYAAADERTTIADRYDDAAAAMGDLEAGAEGQRAVCGGHGVLVETLAGGSLAAGFVAVVRRLAGETAAGAVGGNIGADRGIGLAPGFLAAGLACVGGETENTNHRESGQRGIPNCRGCALRLPRRFQHQVVLYSCLSIQ